MTRQIAVIAESDRNGIRPVSLELMTAAQELQQDKSAEITLYLAGCSVKSTATQLAAKTGCAVCGLEVNPSASYTETQDTAAIRTELESSPPGYVLISHTVRGVAMAGSLAASLKAACITGVEKITGTTDGIGFVRSVSGGKFTTTLSSTAATTVITVQPGSFQPYQYQGNGNRQIDIKTADLHDERIRLVEVKAAAKGAADLANARIVIAAGQGIGHPDSLDLISRLADCFANSAIPGRR